MTPTIYYYLNFNRLWRKTTPINFVAITPLGAKKLHVQEIEGHFWTYGSTYRGTPDPSRVLKEYNVMRGSKKAQALMAHRFNGDKVVVPYAFM